MMKSVIISLLVLLLLTTSSQAAITQRVIYAGDTPLASTCQVTQTGPMELTVVPCTFTTTGEARILSRLDSAFALTGIGPVAKALREGKAEWHGNRVRVWLHDKDGKIIERSVTYHLTTTASIIVPPGDTYLVYLVKSNPGLKMDAILRSEAAPRPANHIHPLVFEFTVPMGTTDLSGIDIEVFTVRPGHAPPKDLFQK